MCKSNVNFRTFLTLLLTFTVVSQAQYSGGSGTQEAPYQLSTVADWQALMDTPDDWDKHFIQTADLDMQAVELSPVGKNSTHFTGVFNGNDHVIRNVVIEQPNGDYIGLFGYLGQNGQILNVSVEDVNIIGDDYVGGLVGYNYHGDLITCFTTGSVVGDDYVGGLVGKSVGGFVGETFEGAIDDCHTTGLVNGDNYVAGLVGRNEHSILTGCFSSGIITGRYSYVGGLVGSNVGSYSDGSITACSATGPVSGDDSVGGLVGANSHGGLIACFATGSVVGDDIVGGLVGKSTGGFVGVTFEGSIHDCHATGSVNGDNHVAGLVGRNEHGILTDCFSSGIITGRYSYVGGLVGSNVGSYSDGSLTACSATGPVSGDDSVGGLVGANSHGDLIACFATGSVVGDDIVGGLVGKSTGGFVGVTFEGSIYDCHATGSVNGDNHVAGLVGRNEHGILTGCSSSGTIVGRLDYVGGLVGSNVGGDSDGGLTACAAAGPVGGRHYVGGLVGQNNHGNLKDCFAIGSIGSVDDYCDNYIGGLIGQNLQGDVNECFARGEVYGVNYVGGLVGDNSSEGLFACYSTGRVEGSGSNIGGLVGRDSQNIGFIDCFWDYETSGLTVSAAGLPKTTAEMQTRNTYTNAGWDFLDEAENGIEETWTIEDINYPRLCWDVYYRIAYAPYPPDGEDDEVYVHLETWIDLSWLPSITAKWHDVYFGDNFDDVNDGLDEVFRGRQTEQSFTVGLPECPYPDGLVPLTTYYWRIDEVNDVYPDSPKKGQVWSFTIAEKKSHYPDPRDGAIEVDPNIILSWTPGFGTQSHTVYFGEDFDFVNNAADGTPQESNFYDPCDIPLKSRTRYYWRVDEFDGLETYKGDVWSFTVSEWSRTWKGQVFSIEDDGYAFGEGSHNLNNAFLRVGASDYYPLPYFTSAMVFRDVDIPQGAEIHSACLKIQSYNSSLTEIIYGRIQAEATDDAAAFSGSHNISSLDKTFAFVDWDHYEPWLENTWYESPNIAEVIQEVINRDGWAANNSLAIIYSTRKSEGGNRKFSSYDRGSDYAPKLEITYIVK